LCAHAAVRASTTNRLARHFDGLYLSFDTDPRLDTEHGESDHEDDA
jgi:hypothetical protein